MAHTTQDLQEFIKEQARSAEAMPADKRAHNRAYLLGVQDAFEFLTSGRTTLGLAERDVTRDDLFGLGQDPNKPAALPKGAVNQEPANPTVDVAADDKDLANQGNDHAGRKTVDKIRDAVSTAFSSRGRDGTESEAGPVGPDEVVRRKR